MKGIDQFVAERAGIIPHMHAENSQAGLYRAYVRFSEKRGLPVEEYDAVKAQLAYQIIGLRNWWEGAACHLVLTGIATFVSPSVEAICEKK